jgi:hypothetical protein
VAAGRDVTASHCHDAPPAARSGCTSFASASRASATPQRLMRILCSIRSGWQRQSPAVLKADGTKGPDCTLPLWLPPPQEAPTGMGARILAPKTLTQVGQGRFDHLACRTPPASLGTRRRFGARVDMDGVCGRPVCQPLRAPEAAIAQDGRVRRRTTTGQNGQPFRGRVVFQAHAGHTPWRSGACLADVVPRQALHLSDRTACICPWCLSPAPMPEASLRRNTRHQFMDIPTKTSPPFARTP